MNGFVFALRSSPMKYQMHYDFLSFYIRRLMEDIGPLPAVFNDGEGQAAQNDNIMAKIKVFFNAYCSGKLFQCLTTLHTKLFFFLRVLLS